MGVLILHEPVSRLNYQTYHSCFVHSHLLLALSLFLFTYLTINLSTRNGFVCISNSPRACFLVFLRISLWISLSPYHMIKASHTPSLIHLYATNSLRLPFPPVLYTSLPPYLHLYLPPSLPFLPPSVSLTKYFPPPFFPLLPPFLSVSMSPPPLSSSLLCLLSPGQVRTPRSNFLPRD